MEEAVKLAQKWAQRNISPLLIADVGTGCGAIAIALAKHIPQAHIFGIDIRPEALEVAGLNVCRNELQDRIELINGDLLRVAIPDVHMVVANLPYIADAEIAALPAEIAKYEPQAAVRGGRNGTGLIGRLIEQSRGKVLPGGAVILEIGINQEAGLLARIGSIFQSADVSVVKDYSGINRIIKIEPRVLTNI